MTCSKASYGFYIQLNQQLSAPFMNSNKNDQNQKSLKELNCFQNNVLYVLQG